VSPRTRPDVQELLTKAANSVVPAVGGDPWEYGWSQPDYRHSDLAALSDPRGPMTMTKSGLIAYEDAMECLLKDEAVGTRWSEDQLWGVVASLAVDASRSQEPAERVASLLAWLRNASETLTVLPLANVSWTGEPLVLSDLVLGVLDEGLRHTIDSNANGRTTVPKSNLDRLSQTYGSTSLVAVAVWGPSQGKLAVAQAERRVRSLLDLSLFLEPEPAGAGLYSLRGPTNRPGVRGVTMHRHAVADGLTAAGAHHELAAEILVVGEGGAQWAVQWHSTDLFPLDDLLAKPARRSALERCLRGELPLARRASVAARWYAEAHWASNAEDAMLALGVSLDALIGSRQGLPGRAMRERFALLEPDPTLRATRARRHAAIYSARSAVAHAGASRTASKAEFVRDVARDVVWTMYRMIAFDALFSPKNDDDLDDGFERLRWGMANWEPPKPGVRLSPVT
jgi:hypothetical protein